MLLRMAWRKRAIALGTAATLPEGNFFVQTLAMILKKIFWLQMMMVEGMNHPTILRGRSSDVAEDNETEEQKIM